MLALLPLEGAVVTTDAMQANRDNSLFLRCRRRTGACLSSATS